VAKAMDEFGFIAEHLSHLAGPEGLDLKDDAAVWQPPAGFDAVISMDTLVEGVHFPQGKFDAETAQKLIAVNISDIIAKGADPLGYFLSLSVPKDTNTDRLKDFSRGLDIAQKEYGIKLWGGDTTSTSGPITLSVTMMGTVPKGKTVLRSGAKIGDFVCVTGNIGGGYLGLKALLKQIDTEKYLTKYWLDRYHLPRPAFAFREVVRAYANSAIDISDGLLADAEHMARASGVGVEIRLPAIPLSTASTAWVLSQPDHQVARLELATGGDDYQILMCVSEFDMAVLKKQAGKAQIKLTVIGKVTVGEGIVCRGDQGEKIPISKLGYSHF